MIMQCDDGVLAIKRAGGGSVSSSILEMEGRRENTGVVELGVGSLAPAEQGGEHVLGGVG